MEKKTLIKAAKELNSVLGLDPPIETKGASKDDLEEGILKAAELIEEGDEISDATQKVLDELEGNSGEDEENEDDNDNGGEDAGNDNEDANANDKKGGKGGKDGKGGKGGKGDKKPKEPKEPKEKRITRLHAAGLAIKEFIGKDMDGLVERADAIFMEAGGPSNTKESTTAVGKALQALAAFGAITIEGNSIR